MALNSNAKLSIEINGKTVQLERSLKSINQAIGSAKSEARSLQDELRFDPGNVDLVIKRQEALTTALKLSDEKAKLLKEDLSKIDPEVNPKGYLKLSQSLNVAEKDTRNLRKSLNDVSNMVKIFSSRPATFKFDVDGTTRTFQNSLRGIDAALSTLGKKSDILNFDKSESNAKDVISQIGKLDKYISLSNKKAELLKHELSFIDIKINPKGFTDLQKKINEIDSDIKSFEKEKANLSIGVDVGKVGKIDKVKNFIGGAISGVSNLGKSLEGPILSGLNSAASSALSFTKSSFSAVGRGIVIAIGASVNGVGAVVDKALIGPIKGAGSGITSAITAPFKVAMSGVHEIVRGALLTVGQNITNSISGTAKGAVKSMDETTQAAKALENVLSFTGTDSNTIEKLKSDMMEYAKVTKFSSAELNKVVSALATSNVEASKAGDLAKDIGNAYALLGDGSRKISDIGVIFSQINSAGKLKAQDFNQLVEAGLGGALKQDIQKNFPEIIAEFGTFAKAMESSAISADMVNQAISRIGKSDAAKNAAQVPKTMREAWDTLNETLGQKFLSTYKEINDQGIKVIKGLTDKIEVMDFAPISEGILNAFKSLGALNGIVKDIFAKVDFSSIFKGLSGGFSDIIGEFKNFLKTDTFSDIAKSLNGIFKNVGSILSGLFNSITSGLKSSGLGNIFDEALKTVLKITDVLKNIAKSDALKSVVVGFISLIGNIVNGVLKVVDAIVSKFNNLGSSGLTEGFGTLGNILNNTTKAAVSFVSALVDGFKRIDFGEILRVFDKLFNKLAELAKSPFFKGFVVGTVKLLSTIFTSVFKLFDDLVGKLNEVTQNVNFDGVTGGFDNLGNIISTLFKVVSNLGGSLIEVFGGEAVGNRVNSLSETLSKLFTTLGDFAKSEGFKAVLESLVATAVTFVDVIAKLSEKLYSALLSEEVQGKLTEFKESFSGLLDSINSVFSSTFVGSLLEESIKLIVEMVTNITTNLKDLVDVFGQLFGGFDFETISKPLSALFDVMEKAYKSFIQPIKDAIKELNEDGSLNDLWDSFKQIGEALAKLIEYSSPVLEFIAKIIGSTLAEVLKIFVNSLKLIAGFLSDIFDYMSKLAKPVSDFIGGIKDWFGDKFGGYGGGGRSRGENNNNYSTYSNISAVTYSGQNTENHVIINVTGSQGMDTLTLARAVRREFTLGTA